MADASAISEMLHGTEAPILAGHGKVRLGLSHSLARPQIPKLKWRDIKRQMLICRWMSIVHIVSRQGDGRDSLEVFGGHYSVQPLQCLGQP